MVLSWALVDETFSDCVLFALMRTNDVSKNRLSKCGSNDVFDANRPLNGVRWFDAAEHGKLIVAAFDFADKFRRFSASGRSNTFESIRVTINFRFGADVVVIGSVLLSSELLLFSTGALLLLLLLLLLLAKSFTFKWSTLLFASMLVSEFDRASLMSTVLRKFVPGAKNPLSIDDPRNEMSDETGETFAVELPLLQYVEFSSISGSVGRWNFVNLLALCAIAATADIAVVSRLSKSSIDTAMSFSKSSLIIVFEFLIFPVRFNNSQLLINNSCHKHSYG